MISPKVAQSGLAEAVLARLLGDTFPLARAAALLLSRLWHRPRQGRIP
jgi:hypothetical protein